jgi:hypothetical protein
MAHGHFEGQDAHSPAVRQLFGREALLSSDWYQERLELKRERDIQLWRRHVAYLSDFVSRPTHKDLADRLGVGERLAHAKRELERVSSRDYLKDLHGTIGADPICRERRFSTL